MVTARMAIPCDLIHVNIVAKLAFQVLSTKSQSRA